MGRTAVAATCTLAACALLLEACRTVPPTDVTNACEIFEDRPAWQDAVVQAGERWDVHPATILAFVHQESRFRATARPGWRRAFGVIPVGPRSSAVEMSGW